MVCLSLYLYRIVAPALGFLGLALYAPGLHAEEPKTGWGIDACLTWQGSPENAATGLDLLRQSSVHWARERGVWIKDPVLAAAGGDETVNRLRAMKAAGLHVVAFAGGPVPAERPGNQLPEDLLAVYAAAFRQGRDCAEIIDAWELTGEPDVGYCRDLPDRLAAYNKAMYLGLHDGAASVGRSTIVLMGALALPAGPWLERAARNGVLDYTDAYNFHYYGNPDELTSHIRAHRGAQRVMQPLAWPAPLRKPVRPSDRSGPSSVFCPPLVRSLPMWITECGVNATVPGDFLNAERRAFQADFTRMTAQQARAARDVAVFMPFIFVHKDDPHAMVQAETMTPLPAWEAYSRLTREQAWPKRTLISETDRAGRVVLQWMPAAGTPSHKVAGTYRVHGLEPVQGEFRIYNFGNHPVTGALEVPAVGNMRTEVGVRRAEDGGRGAVVGDLTIPAGGSVAVPVSYSPRMVKGYFREWTTARFREGKQRVSQVAFGLERLPDAGDFTMQPVAVYSLDGDSRLHPPWVNVEGASSGSPWRVFNGLAAEPVVGGRKTEGSAMRFSVAKPVNDPLAPTYALAALKGVPAGARFLHLRLNRPMGRGACVRVDLVDEEGQRFTIWENFGVPYGEAPWDVWLGLADFHPYLWSTVKAGNRRLRPERVREIGLRVYLQEGGTLEVGLEWAIAQ